MVEEGTFIGYVHKNIGLEVACLDHEPLVRPPGACTQTHLFPNVVEGGEEGVEVLALRYFVARGFTPRDTPLGTLYERDDAFVMVVATQMPNGLYVSANTFPRKN